MRASVLAVLGALALLTSLIPNGIAGAAGPGSTAAASEVPDPLEAGPHQVRQVEYDALVTVVQNDLGGIPGYAYPERLRGTLYFPETSPGPFPAVVILHGRHSTCRVAGSTEALLWPCPDAPPAIEDLPSWRGFGYLATNLASHGYVVMSINANAVNMYGSLDGTPERAQVVEDSLDLLTQWNAGARPVPDGVGDSVEGRVDLSRIGLVGHSRGADGVTEFLVMEQERGADRRYPGLRAVLALQAVDMTGNFGETANSHNPAGAHFASLQGTCDGDVGFLGAPVWDRGRYSDAAAPFSRVHFQVAGASHNYFNSEWPDEWDEAGSTASSSDDNVSCSHHRNTNIRLTRQDQQNVGLALMNAFLRRYVGGELSFEPLMSGAGQLPPSACPTGRVRQGHPLPCDQLTRVAYLPPAAERHTLLKPDGASLETEAGESLQADGFESVDVCGREQRPCRPGVASSAWRLQLEWTEPAAVRIGLAPEERDVSTFRTLAFRAAMNAGENSNDGVTEQDLDVVLVDSAGREAVVAVAGYSNALLRPQPDNYSQSGWGVTILSGVRLPLTTFSGVDLTDLARIELRFGGRTGSGSIQIADIAFQETTT